MIFLFTFVTFSKQTAGLEKKSYSLEWPAYHDKRVEGPNIYVSWTGTKLGPQTCFINKQLTNGIKFQMLFEHNVVSNVTSNQEPLHKIQIKHYFYVQFPFVGAILGKNWTKFQ